MADSPDWEIDSNGLYVATRSFLVRRGFCCANQCRNCPYIGTALDRYPGPRRRPPPNSG